MPEPIIEIDVSKLKPNPTKDTIYENNQFLGTDFCLIM